MEQIRRFDVKCDNPECGWGKAITDINELQIGYACPVCGNVVINEEDMKSIRIIKRLLKIDRFLSRIMFWRKPKTILTAKTDRQMTDGELQTTTEITVERINER